MNQKYYDNIDTLRNLLCRMEIQVVLLDILTDRVKIFVEDAYCCESLIQARDSSSSLVKSSITTTLEAVIHSIFRNLKELHCVAEWTQHEIYIVESIEKYYKGRLYG